MNTDQEGLSCKVTVTNHDLQADKPSAVQVEGHHISSVIAPGRLGRLPVAAAWKESLQNGALIRLKYRV